MLKTMLIITLIAFVINVYCAWYIIIKSREMFIAQYGEEAKKYLKCKSKKQTFLLHPKFILFLVPLINIISAFCYLFKTEQTISDVYSSMERKYLAYKKEDIA